MIEECKITFGPKKIIYPSFATSVSELRDKLNKNNKQFHFDFKK